MLLSIAIPFLACNEAIKKTNYFTDEFNFTNRNGDQSTFYGFKDKDSAMFWAKKEKKHLMLLFSCYACMAESGNEWRTLSYYGNNAKIQDNFILLWLPVDDKTPLKDSILVNWLGKDKYLNTIGSRNNYWQNELTNTNTQPTMCFIDTNENRIGYVLNYERDEQKLRFFIESGR